VCPELQVSSFGDTLEEAEKSLKEALDLFFEGCESMGTINEVLEESGFQKVGEKWVYRKPIKRKKTTLKPISTPPESPAKDILSCWRR
jgi:predicted RNase H-like HicB family nuclease